MSEGVFVREGGFYRPTQHSGGPWSPDTLHGGPVAGLLAHTLEEAEDREGFRWSRLQFDLLRPVPRAPLSATTEVVRSGRRLQLRQASLWDEEGRLLARAHALSVAEQTLAEEPVRQPGADESMPSREGLPTTRLEFAGDLDPPRILPGFASMIELRRIRGIEGKGMGCAWVRIPEPLVRDVPTSSRVRAAASSDFANGLSQRFLGAEFGFINADITVHLFREPAGEWMGIDSSCDVDAKGLGWVSAKLFDDRGRLGLIHQCLLVAPRYTG
jgi:hypothetical protein